MEANAKSLTFLSASPQKLVIPFFQRRYIWKESNWDELLRTLRDPAIEPFLGSIILKLAETQNPTEALVIDGQQRLTTLTLLAKAIHDTLPTDQRSGIRRTLENHLFYKIHSSDEFSDSSIKIEHSQLDRAEYEEVINAGLKNSDDVAAADKSSGQIKCCYSHFMRKLHEIMYETDGIKKVKAIHDVMFSDAKKMIVLIEFKKGGVSEQVIFDTINRAGVRLSSADIIKNNLFKGLLDKCATDKEKQEIYSGYKTNWESVFSQELEEMMSWDSKRMFGNTERTNLEFLLYSIACIRWGKHEKIFADLPLVFDSQTSGYSKAELLTLAMDIKAYGEVYKKYIIDFKQDLDCDEVKINFSYVDYEKRMLLILEKFGIQMFYPYVIKVLKDRDDGLKKTKKDEEIARLHNIARDALRPLESFLVRQKVAGKGVSGYADKCFEVLLDSGKMRNWFIGDISDNAMKSALRSIKNDTAKMVLFWIELFKRSGLKNDIKELDYRYSLEHIMPDKWETHWGTVALLGDDGKPMKNDANKKVEIGTEAGKEVRRAYIKNIGNMTLLTQNLNGAIKHAEFSKKVEGDGKRVGYGGHTSLYITREIVDAYGKGDKTWDEKHIRARFEVLVALFNQIWSSSF